MMTCIMRVDQGDIGAGNLAEPEAGMPHQAVAPGVDDDEILIFETRRPLDAGRNHRVIFVGVGADHQDAIGILQFGDGIGHGSGTEGRGQPGHGGAVSEAGAVIHVVGADRGAQQFLHQVIFFVGGPGRTPAANLFGAVFFLHLPEAAGHKIEGLIPGGLLEFAVLLFPEERGLEAVCHAGRTPCRTAP